MAELADAPDLGSGSQECRFDPCYPYQENDKFQQKFVVFSYIRLRRVILLRSDIRLTPRDIALRAGLEANIISLKSQISRVMHPAQFFRRRSIL